MFDSLPLTAAAASLKKSVLENPALKSPYDLPAPAPATGRNAPGPCGSGKKYKKCCMK